MGERLIVRRSDNCYSCRFWVGHGVRERGPKGDCHRYPPLVTDRFPAGAIPTTNFTDWCGEWQRNSGTREVPEPAASGNANLYDDL